MPSDAQPEMDGLPPLIPRRVLFGNPDRMNPQISPDAKYFSYLAPDDNDVLQIWLRRTGQQDDRQITREPHRGIQVYFWTYDARHLVYLQDSDGDENYHLYSVDVESDVVRDLTPFQGVQARFIAKSPRAPDALLVAMNLRNRELHDVYRIDLTSGAVDLDTENPGQVVEWTADADLRVRAALGTTADGGKLLLARPDIESDWRLVRKYGADDDGGPVAFSEDGERLYIVDNLEANTQRLLVLLLETGEAKAMAEDPQYDVADVLVHPVKRCVEAVAFYRETLEWDIVNETIRGDFEHLRQVRRGEVRLASRDLDEKTWIFSYSTDDGPVYYYRYEPDSGKTELLFSNQPKLEEAPLAQMQPISFQARDGLPIHGYLTTPVGVPARNLPTVLKVHGGPWARDRWGFTPLVQLLANRGYAVLQVNYRGSSGYGKSFLNAGNRQWAGRMHEDLIDGVNWAVEEGIADPGRVAIMGGSYGGYATLVGLTMTPDVFAAGVDLVGPSNLITLLNSIPPYWKPLLALFTHRVGPLEDEEFLRKRSPLYYVDNIRAPLLIGQGANDPRVKQAESEQIVEAMREKGKPVEYIVYRDEGHGFRRPQNNLHFYMHAEHFLARHIGGRTEDMEKIEGHSGVVEEKSDRPAEANAE